MLEAILSLRLYNIPFCARHEVRCKPFFDVRSLFQVLENTIFLNLVLFCKIISDFCKMYLIFELHDDLSCVTA